MKYWRCATKSTIWHRSLPLLAAFLALPQAIAQEDSTIDSEPVTGQVAAIAEDHPEAGPGEVVDEITVRGFRSLNAIQRDIDAADNVMNNIFNELNDDNKFDIICQLEKKPPSHIKHRVCKPNFERGLINELWEDRANTPDFRRPAAEIRRDREILKQKMLALAADNPDLAAAIIERAQLQQVYEREQARRLED